jgi:hypothetical protein
MMRTAMLCVAILAVGEMLTLVQAATTATATAPASKMAAAAAKMG